MTFYQCCRINRQLTCHWRKTESSRIASIGSVSRNQCTRSYEPRPVRKVGLRQPSRSVCQKAVARPRGSCRARRPAGRRLQHRNKRLGETLLLARGRHCRRWTQNTWRMEGRQPARIIAKSARTICVCSHGFACNSCYQSTAASHGPDFRWCTNRRDTSWG
jgi:hypothetical protein